MMAILKFLLSAKAYILVSFSNTSNEFSLWVYLLELNINQLNIFVILILPLY